MTYSLPNCCLYKRAKKVNNLFPHCCLYKKRAKRVNDLLTPTVSPVKKNKEDELLTHSYTVAYLYKRAERVNALLTPKLLPVQKKQRGWMTYSLPNRAKRVNDLLTPTLWPIQKSQEGKWLTHSHNVAYTKEPRGWITYSLPHSCIYKRAKRVNDLLTSTLLTIRKSKEDEWHSLPL